MFSLYYQNVRGLRSKTNLCYNNILNSNFVILVLTETWLNQSILNSEIFPCDFSIYQKDRSAIITGTSRLMMKVFVLLIFGILALGTSALIHVPSFKEHEFSEALFRDVIEKMGRDLDSYIEDGVSEQLGYPQLISRSYKDSDYQDSPSPRDHEYLQHSSLWANLMQGSNDNEAAMPQMELMDTQKSQQNAKQENLPAYCNPPNPCPYGYTAEEGCLEIFENTAAFSRDYQGQQDCMCDTEHMFDCSSSHMSNDLQSDLDRYRYQFHVEDEHKSLVAKKFHVKKDHNPYLLGEKLPIAAKKGIDIGYYDD